ncbi:hypothetical protein [Isoptericola sp. BMS4]|uniref:hypothetical protein n=1 Tax=Isoptericola sp. BMS4 TaxID=2527875 RepID=UPI001424514F|nr:hypothetical protein [Isoptericola sp. BMS4]
MPPSSRRRRLVSFWLVVVPAWVVSIALGVAWVGLGVFWSVDSWQATHGGIEGRFIPQVKNCGRDCTWSGDFVSDDGEHDLADVQFSSGFGEPQPEATGEALEPVVVSPGGIDVYNPHDKTWAFAWVMAAMGPAITWVMIIGIRQARAQSLRKEDEDSELHERGRCPCGERATRRPRLPAPMKRTAHSVGLGQEMRRERPHQPAPPEVEQSGDRRPESDVESCLHALVRGVAAETEHRTGSRADPSSHRAKDHGDDNPDDHEDQRYEQHSVAVTDSAHQPPDTPVLVPGVDRCRLVEHHARRPVPTTQAIRRSASPDLLSHAGGDYRLIRSEGVAGV